MADAQIGLTGRGEMTAASKGWFSKIIDYVWPFKEGSDEASKHNLSDPSERPGKYPSGTGREDQGPCECPVWSSVEPVDSAMESSVGLNGTGDSDKTTFMTQSVVAMLARNNVRVDMWTQTTKWRR